MARTIGSLCTFIVGLQILVGVPLFVCGAFFCATNGPINVEIHTGHGQAPQLLVHGATIPPPGGPFAVGPPPNTIPVTAAASLDNPILQSRVEHGSPLVGTVLESANPAEEQDTFLSALEKAAAEHTNQPPEAVCRTSECCSVDGDANPAVFRNEADSLIVRLLYEMAGIDEQGGEYGRADQWRAFARGIKEGREVETSREGAAASWLLPVGQSPNPAGN